MIRHRLPVTKPQELAQRQAVGAAPLQPALAVNAFKVADQQHAEVPPGRQRGPALPRRVVGRALALDEAVEPSAEQFGLEAVVEPAILIRRIAARASSCELGVDMGWRL